MRLLVVRLKKTFPARAVGSASRVVGWFDRLRRADVVQAPPSQGGSLTYRGSRKPPLLVRKWARTSPMICSAVGVFAFGFELKTNRASEGPVEVAERARGDYLPPSVPNHLNAIGAAQSQYCCCDPNNEP